MWVASRTPLPIIGSVTCLERGIVVRIHVVRHKHSGKSAGYGFVEMGSGEQALFEGNCLGVFVMPYASAYVRSAQPAEGAYQ